VFIQEGCPACEAFKPKFDKVAARYSHLVPVYVLDAQSTDPHVQNLADRIGVVYTPTTAALQKPSGIIKIDGDQSEATVKRLFDLAVAHR
jgi:thiol-disulfide isomerase/thioredoxin